MFVRQTTLAVLLLTVSLLCSERSVAQGNPREGVITFRYCDLLNDSNSHSYKSNMVRVRAIYESDFELSALNAPRCWPLKTWVRFDNEWEKRSSWRNRRAINSMRFGMSLDVVLVGKFESDGRYGHMDMYTYQLTVYKVESATSLGRFRELPDDKKRHP